MNSNEPNHNCEVGKNVGVCLEGFYSEIQTGIEETMQMKTIDQLYKEGIN